MIVNICGATGQGKSEVISYLKEEGYQVETLLPTENRPKNLKEFCNSQEDLLMYRDRLIHGFLDEESSDILIIESSFIEMFVYSLLAIGINFDYKTWLNSYYEMCYKAQRKVNLVINLPLNSRESSSLPYFTARSFNILSKYYQGEVDKVTNNKSLFVPENNDGQHFTSEDICEYVKELIEINYKGFSS